MKKSELVFIPAPLSGHLLSAIELANLLLTRNDDLSITVLFINLPFEPKINSYTESLSASSTTDRIRFIHLPKVPFDQQLKLPFFINSVIENHKPHVKDAVTKLTESENGTDSPRLAGFVIDMLCTAMIDVANEFGVPTYLFFAPNAVFLGVLLHFQALYDDNGEDLIEFFNSETELVVPSFANPLPTSILPSAILDRDWASALFYHARRYRETKGIMVNTFLELESHALSWFSSSTIPPVYPVGPILKLKREGLFEANQCHDIMTWLDDQPPSSVVFLCFGSAGTFDEDQAKEIARGLEESGVRFLWSLRFSPPKGMSGLLNDYSNSKHEDAFPDGFFDRTDGVGKIIGWAPQVEILSHRAIGGFVSHCGWNSVLESLWYGVPIATWPIYSEQQLNAFEMVVELGLAVEIKLNYRNSYMDSEAIIVSSAEILMGIRKLMEDDVIRNRVKDMSERSKKVLLDGGSSFTALNRFISDVFKHSLN